MLAAYLAAGIVALYGGAEWLVRGAARLARRLGVSPLMIGMTVIGFGTSAPELLVSIVASAKQQSVVALGNASGSNVLNIALILGVAAVIRPLAAGTSAVVREIVLMVAATAAFILVLLTGDGISRLEGVALLVGFAAYMAFVVRQAGRSPDRAAAEFEDFERARKLERDRPLLFDVALVLAGLVALVLGARWFLYAAVAFGQRAGMSQLVIGLTVVAIGTSLPELATSVVAALRGESDIVLGNVIGSNVFNLLLNIGVAACIRPIVVEARSLTFDLAALAVATLALLTMLLVRKGVGRWEGALLLSGYVAYTFLLLERS